MELAEEEDKLKKRSKKLLSIIAITAILIAVLFYANQPAEEKTQKIEKTSENAVTTTENLEKIVFEFEPQEYQTPKGLLTLEHSLKISKEGRTETITITNNAEKPIDFSLAKIIPKEIYENDYSLEEKTLSFANEEESEIQVTQHRLKPGETLAIKVASSYTGGIGFLILTVYSENVDLEELKQTLKEKTTKGINLLELTPENAESISNSLTTILNDDEKYLTWEEKKLAIEKIKSENTQTISEEAFIQLTNTASEIQPSAFLEMPLFGAEKKDVVYRVDGDLSNFLKETSETIEDGVKIVKLFFEFEDLKNKETGLFEEEKLEGKFVVGVVGEEELNEIELRVYFTHPIDAEHYKPSLRHVKTEKGAIIELKDNLEVILSEEHNTWHTCSEFKCGCEVLANTLQKLNEVYLEDVKEIKDAEAYKKANGGSDEYEKSVLLLTRDLTGCVLPYPYEEIPSNSASLVTIKSNINSPEEIESEIESKTLSEKTSLEELTKKCLEFEGEIEC